MFVRASIPNSHPQKPMIGAQRSWHKETWNKIKDLFHPENEKKAMHEVEQLTKSDQNDFSACVAIYQRIQILSCKPNEIKIHLKQVAIAGLFVAGNSESQEHKADFIMGKINLKQVHINASTYNDLSNKFGHILININELNIQLRPRPSYVRLEKANGKANNVIHGQQPNKNGSRPVNHYQFYPAPKPESRPEPKNGSGKTQHEPAKTARTVPPRPESGSNHRAKNHQQKPKVEQKANTLQIDAKIEEMRNKFDVELGTRISGEVISDKNVTKLKGDQDLENFINKGGVVDISQFRKLALKYHPDKLKNKELDWVMKYINSYYVQAPATTKTQESAESIPTAAPAA